MSANGLLYPVDSNKPARPSLDEDVPAPRTVPLSAFQERLVVIHQLEPESTAYNLATIWEHPGISSAAVVAAIRDVVARHEILRTTFDADGINPTGVVLPPERVPVDVITLAPGAEWDRQAELDRLVHRPFDLATEPSIRWRVYGGGEAPVATLVCAHHIAVDEASFGLLRRYVEEAIAGEHAPVRQFRDYVELQRSMEESPEAETDLSWSTRHLQGLPQFCTLMADRAGGKPSGAAYDFCWDATFSDSIRKMAQQQNATLYMILLGAMAVVLRAHAGHADIAIGCPMGMRERPEFEEIVGPFVNLLTLRLDLSDDPTFNELARRARDAVLDAHDHRLASFEKVVERLNPTRTFDRSPLFQVAVVLHNAAAAAQGAQSIYSGGAVLDLTWFAREVEGRIEGSFEYRSDLFERETIGRVANQLEAVLAAAVRDPSRKVSTISLLSEAERHEVVEAFNQTAVETEVATFIEQFEREVATHPQRIALAFQGREVSLRELGSGAVRLAAELARRGIGPGHRVGMHIERSPEMLIALIGIMKAGAAFVALDPELPTDRLNFLASDSDVSAVVVHGSKVAVLHLTVPVVDMATLPASVPAQPPPGPRPQDAAYLIYTSGSTGKPNGVVVSHASLANFLGGMKRVPGLSGAKVIAAIATVSFDVATVELFLPLLTGMRIELFSRKIASDGVALAEGLASAGVSVVQATPATWRMLIDSEFKGGPDLVAFSGAEPLNRDLAEALLARVGELWNLYGPTETTVWTTAGRILPSDGVIHIGRPLANTRVYVVNDSGEPCPIGVPGEIWIGGSGVSGYHSRDDLMAARFISDPFSRAAGARIYRTGDLGRWLANGSLIHLGRRDRQMKVRGFRIEPGEIEVALCSHPAVTRSVVTSHQVGADDVKLVAYVVCQRGMELTTTEARQFLRERLPPYMVPSLYVLLDELPMTATGKINARALPDPFKSALRGTAQYVPPKPGLEQTIAEIWQDILKVDRVSADDNFFDLGGHSLLSVRVAVAIQKRTGLVVPPRSLFFQTLRQVATVCLEAAS